MVWNPKPDSAVVSDKPTLLTEWFIMFSWFYGRYKEARRNFYDNTSGTEWECFKNWSTKTRNNELTQSCVLLLIINILNVQISVLRFPASWPDFFIKWSYIRVWHEWHDLKWSHILLLSSNLTCNLHYSKYRNIFITKYFENLQINTTFIYIHDVFCIFFHTGDNVCRIDILQNSYIRRCLITLNYQWLTNSHSPFNWFVNK